MNTPILEQDQLQVWQEHVMAVYPKEAVALVIDGKVIPVDNVAEDAEENFKVAPKDFVGRFSEISAILHSHTYTLDEPYLMDKRIPSKRDLANQLNNPIWWGISSCEGENVSDILWFGNDRGEPYEGREFIYNVVDCFELVRDYYRRELGFDIPRFARDWNWQDEKENNYFDDNWQAAGFVEVNIDDIQVGDVVCFAIGSDKTNHVGVYLGDDVVLHHLFGRLSGKDTFSKWRRHILRILRIGDKNAT